ncbi:hypothetical protein ACFY7C_36755 [Streptomyces sp. NPDC012769]|uniref:hypothetical protein n=1 Tax=Streptomyces sp. NPDC012769 TaxID=3364848 RepID=UPI0036ABDDF7
MSEEKFNEELPTLLSRGYVYTGSKTGEYPNGNICLELVKVDTVTQQESTVMGTYRTFIPQQQSTFTVDYRDEQGKEKTQPFTTQTEALAFINACESSERVVLGYNFKRSGD